MKCVCVILIALICCVYNSNLLTRVKEVDSSWTLVAHFHDLQLDLEFRLKIISTKLKSVGIVKSGGSKRT